jgi:4-hydroxybenzoate polyprenyltransferase
MATPLSHAPRRTSSLKAYLQLMRPANIVTAMADILAGYAVARQFLLTPPIASGLALDVLEIDFATPLLLLLLSTIGLYGGGVVFNDVFDARLDAVERPERPIPSGRASLQGAAILGLVLLLIGIAAAAFVSAFSGVLATGIAVLALVYDKYGKHTPLGPVNMGLCRGLNLLLGVSAFESVRPDLGGIGVDWLVVSSAVESYWPIALIPIVYIAAITMISRGEVHGGDKKTIKLAVSLYSLVIMAIIGLSTRNRPPLWETLPFLLLFGFLIFPPVFKAIREPQPRNIGLAVKAGVISLIVMDAALAASFAGWLYGLGVLALLPVSRLLAKTFAVT